MASHFGNTLYPEYNNIFFTISDYAVLIFFSLSGFVISYNYKFFTFSFINFITARFSRIFPTLFICLLFTFLFDSLRFRIDFINNEFNESCNIYAFLSSLLMVNFNYYIDLLTDGNSFTFFFDEFGSCRVLWSLSLEWSIYLLYGFYFSRSKRFNFSWYILIIPYLFIILISLFYARVEFITISWIICSISVFFINKDNHKYNFFIISLLIVLLISIFETKILLLTAPLIVIIFHKYNLSKKISSISIFFAKISYPLYLIHIPLFLLVSPFLISYGPLLCFLFSCFLSIIVAYFLYELIDKRYKSINLIISKKLKLNNGF